jgi:RND family efflux transporter MFP subunit
MKSMLAVVLLVLMLFLGGQPGCSKDHSPEGQYHCPMHPTYITDTPGDCPICGMRLVPISKEKSAATPMSSESITNAAPSENATLFTCPMHPEVISDKPGKCPKCGMDLVPNKEESSTKPDGEKDNADGSPSGEKTILFYRNPMDPTITSKVPMKDSMGMDYVPVFADEAQSVSSAIEGLAPVTLSETALNLAGIRTAVATLAKLGGTIRTVGIVLPDERRVRRVHIKVTGYVDKLYVNFTGQSVQKGQPIIGIYSPELLASQQEYLRAIETAKRLSKSSLDDVQQGGKDLVTAARRRLELFDVPKSFIEKLELSGRPQRTVTLVAPFSGFANVKNIFEGQQVDPGMELFAITDLSSVWIEADFYEYEAHAVKLGQEANLTLPYDPTKSMKGKVSFIYPTLNPDSRTLKVRFDVPNKGLALKPDMYANVELMGEDKEGVIFPDSAVMDTGTRQIVFVETTPGHFEPRQVHVTGRSDGNVQIASGIQAGEKVVVHANFLLDSESRLKSAIAGSVEQQSESGNP